MALYKKAVVTRWPMTSSLVTSGLVTSGLVPILYAPAVINTQILGAAIKRKRSLDKD